jgi:hypothetical protein
MKLRHYAVGPALANLKLEGTRHLPGLRSSFTLCPFVKPKNDGSRARLWKARTAQTWLPDDARPFSPTGAASNYFGPRGAQEGTVPSVQRHFSRGAVREHADAPYPY